MFMYIIEYLVTEHTALVNVGVVEFYYIIPLSSINMIKMIIHNLYINELCPVDWQLNNVAVQYLNPLIYIECNFLDLCILICQRILLALGQ